MASDSTRTGRLDEPVCDLCGLPLRQGAVSARYASKEYHFCCLGCRQVFAILIEAADAGDPANFKNTALYKSCQSLGIIPSSEADLRALETQAQKPKSNQTGSESTVVPETQLPQETLPLQLQVDNMWCPACAWVIDERLLRLEGVIASRCDFSTDRLTCRYDPIVTSPEKVKEAIARIGYTVRPADADQTSSARRKELIRLCLAAVFTMNIMMLSVAVYSGFWIELTAISVHKIAWPAWVMATVVLVYGGWPLLRRAAWQIPHGAFGMESLVVAGATFAYGYSVINYIRGSVHLYFDTAAMLITLVLLGKLLERRAKDRVQAGLDAFLDMMPAKVKMCADAFPEGRYVTTDSLAAGDLFRLAASEICPADGEVTEGRAAIDESSLTGEARPLQRRPGDQIRSGARVISGDLTIRAHTTADASMLGQMIQIMRQSLEGKTRLEGKTDRLLRILVPAIFVLAIATGVVAYLLGQTLDQAVIRAITVMVISCPCALGIAIPLTRVAGIAIAGRKGLLVRNFKAFDLARQIDTVIFDKTGTVTEGRWRLLQTLNCGRLAPDQVLALAAGLEQTSEHYVAAEIRRRAAEAKMVPLAVTDPVVHENGVQAKYHGQALKIGSRDFVAPPQAALQQLNIKADLDLDIAPSMVYMTLDDRLEAVFIFGDRLQSSAQATVRALKQKGARLGLVSGDGTRVTASVARKLDIDQARGGQLPLDKARWIADHRQHGRRVAMVGDGVNDAPAMVEADLGIGVFGGAQLTKEATDVTLVRGDVGQLLDFLALADGVQKKIFQNLGCAFGYNLISIPIAMSGLLTPLVAVTAMLLSSLSVIGNTLLLIRKNT